MSWLRDQRRRLRHSQRKAGEILGVHPVTVARWEAGTILPGVRQVIPIAEWAGVEVAEVLGWISEVAEAMDTEPAA